MEQQQQQHYDHEEEEDDYEDEEEQPQIYREMITNAWHFSDLPLGGADTLDRSLSCPICLSIMRAPTATECLHRFCSECIETSIRIGKKECPSCRFPIATRRALRRDLNFEALMLTLFPGGVEDEDDDEDIAANLAQYRHVPLRPEGWQEPAARAPSPSTAENATAGGGGGGRGNSRAVGKSPKVKASQREDESNAPAAVAERKGGVKGKSGGGGGGSSGRAGAAAVEEEEAEDEPAAPKAVKWSCPLCTLINTAAAKKCKACETPNPALPVKPSALKVKRGGGAAAAEYEDDEDRPLTAHHGASPAVPGHLRRVESNGSGATARGGAAEAVLAKGNDAKGKAKVASRESGAAGRGKAKESAAAAAAKAAEAAAKAAEAKAAAAAAEEKTITSKRTATQHGSRKEVSARPPPRLGRRAWAAAPRPPRLGRRGCRRSGAPPSSEPCLALLGPAWPCLAPIGPDGRRLAPGWRLLRPAWL